MWEGDLEFTEEMGPFRLGARVEVKLRTQQYNVRNLETLDWTKGLPRYPLSLPLSLTCVNFFQTSNPPNSRSTPGAT